MAKKSKSSSVASSSSKSKKKDRRNLYRDGGAGVETDANVVPVTSTTGTTPKQLNPFYIEQPSATAAASETWQGDWNEYDDMNEYDDEYTEQAQGLLGHHHHDQQHQHHSNFSPSTARQEHSSRRSDEDDDGGSWKVRACIVCSILPFLLGIFVATHTSSPAMTPNNSRPTNVPPTPAPSKTESPSWPPPTALLIPTMIPIVRGKEPTPRQPIPSRTKSLAPTLQPQQLHSSKPKSVSATLQPFSDIHLSPLPGIDAVDHTATVEDDDITTNVDENKGAKNADSEVPPEQALSTTIQKADTVSWRQRIVVLGERHSGVEWAIDVLQRCLTTTEKDNEHNATATMVQSGLGRRGAYWFQYANNDDDKSKDQLYEATKSSISSKNAIATRTTVIIVMIRNPYDWVQEMWQNPLYAPAHYNHSSNRPLPLQSFLSKPWSLNNNNDITKREDTTAQSPVVQPKCQLGFTPDQVTPCLLSSPSVDCDVIDASVLANGSAPIYELDPITGKVFANIMAMRTRKLQYVLDEIVPMADPIPNSDRSNHVFLVPYETGFFGRPIWDSFNRLGFGIQNKAATCQLPPPTALVGTNDTTLSLQLRSTSYKKWMLNHVDWEVEASVGYFP